jgi:ferredoxin--NADP+ reductase
MSVKLNAIVTQRMDVAPGMAIIRVAPDGWELPKMIPGQFAVLGLPGSAPRGATTYIEPEDPPPDPDKLIRRAYSIASSPLETDYFEFYVALVTSGALTPRIFALQVGDRIWLGPKISGLFTLDSVPKDQHVVMVATGTGLAPYMSMMRTYLDASEPQHFAVLHGARHSWDLGYESELHILNRLSDRFTYLPIVSRPQLEPVPWAGQVGHVQKLWTDGALQEAWGFAPRPEDTHIFLCGNPQMIEDMQVLLVEQGYLEHKKKRPGQIHYEKYW